MANKTVYGAFFFIFLVVVSIFIGIYMRSENSFLEAVGGRNAANQKLMVVDQSTGEISFVKKSLSGINKNFTDQDVIVTNALKNLLGDNMSNYGGYTKTGNDGVISKLLMGSANKTNKQHTKWYYDQIQSLRTSRDALETFMNGFLYDNTHGRHTGAQMRTALFNKIDHGAGIRIEHKDDKSVWRTLGTHDCNIENGNKEGAHWCDAARNETRIVKW
jgi:hypothetical protein